MNSSREKDRTSARNRITRRACGHSVPCFNRAWIRELDRPRRAAYPSRLAADPPTCDELDKRIIRLEECMNTQQADLRATLEGFRTDAARRETDAERRETEAAKRETRFVFHVIAIVGIGFTIFGLVTAS